MAPKKKSLLEPTAVPFYPQHDDIASLAYEFFLQRGCAHGLDLEDWLHAERELLTQQPAAPALIPKPTRRRKAASGASAR